MGKKPTEKVKIRAIHDDDLNFFLKKIGLFEKIKNSQLKCVFCDCVLTLENFGGVYKENGKIKPFCQKTECYLEVLKRRDQAK